MFAHGSANDSQNHLPFMHEQSMPALVPSPHSTTPEHDKVGGPLHAPPFFTALGGGHVGWGAHALIVHTKCEPSHMHMSWYGELGHFFGIGHWRFLVVHDAP